MFIIPFNLRSSPSPSTHFADGVEELPKLVLGIVRVLA